MITLTGKSPGKGQVELAWSADFSPANWKLQQAVVNGWRDLATCAGNSLRYLFTGIEDGVHFYRVGYYDTFSEPVTVDVGVAIPAAVPAPVVKPVERPTRVQPPKPATVKRSTETEQENHGTEI
jgi:hypothetical protein